MPREYDFQVYCAFKRFFKGWGGLSDHRNGIRKVISRNRNDPVVSRLLAEKGTGNVVRSLQELINAKAFNKGTKFEALFPSIAHPEPFMEGADGSKIPGKISGPKTILPLRPSHQSVTTSGAAGLSNNAEVRSNPGPSTTAKPPTDTSRPSTNTVPGGNDAAPAITEQRGSTDLDLSRWKPTADDPTGVKSSMGPTTGSSFKSFAMPSARPVTSLIPRSITKPTARFAGPVTRPTARPEARPTSRPTTTKAVGAPVPWPQPRPTRYNEPCLKPGATKGTGLGPSRITKPTSTRSDRSSGNRVQDRLAAIQVRRLVGSWGGPLLTSEPAAVAPAAKMEVDTDEAMLPVERETSYKLVQHDPWYAEKPQVTPPEQAQQAPPAELQAEVGVSVPVPAPAPVTVTAPVASEPMRPAMEGGQVLPSFEAGLTIKPYFPIVEQTKILEEAMQVIKTTAFRIMTSEKPAVVASAGVTDPSQLTLRDAVVALRLSNDEMALSPSFQSFTWLEQAIHERKRMEPSALAQLICGCAREIGGIRDPRVSVSLDELKRFTVQAVVQCLDSHTESLRKAMEELGETRAKVLSW
ncbi:hypothetical protein Dda_1476 [Drechslerella dactyloides]|uniref:Uncharacterized protein n=1 Tax=Drechslerella dactyloides TaxID=74499 RepID=A0AAD6J1T2_DREDA|nr:hypothetical protein Dda_1476 [Drechslerella dactyloides]